MFIQNLASSAKHGRFTVEQMSLLKSYLLSVISNQMVIFGLSASFSDSDEYVLISMKLDSMLSGFVNRIISQHSDGLVHDLDVFVTGIVSNAAKNSDINDIRKELALDDEEEEQFYNFTPSRYFRKRESAEKRERLMHILSKKKDPDF